MRLFMGGRTLLVGALLLFLTFGVAERCQEEIPLPKTLDLQNNEIHIHGSYRAPLGERSEISFVLSMASYFRFYMAEHKIVDMDVELVDSHSAIVDLSMSVWGEEMLASKLEPGSYKIIFTPFLVDNKADRTDMCESLTLEISISSVQATDSRVAKLPAFDGTFIPPISTEAIDSYMSHGKSFSYDSTEDRDSDLFNVKPPPTSDLAFGPEYLAHWSFELKAKAGTNPLFDFEVRLGYNFLTSGNMRLLLDNSHATDKPACEAAEDETKECKRGANVIENTYVIQTKLGPGNYTLWLFDTPDRRITTITSHPFTLQIDILQMHGDESFLSCPQQFLPASLNSPGLIDATGFLHFRDEVLLDLDEKSQTVTFTVPSAFLFRVWTDQHRVDIDIVLKKKGGSQIARTFRTAGQAESIIAQGEAEVEYELSFKYYGRYDTIFCESFLLELLIQPLTPYYQFDYCATASPDSKPSIPRLVNVKDKFNIPRTEYRFAWNATKHHDDIIVDVPIVTTKASVESHFFSGLDMMVSTLVTEGGSSQRRFTRPITHRGGMELSFVLEAGLNHTFVLRGGPHSGVVDISSFPPCAFFSFEIDISPVSSLGSISRCPDKRLPEHLDGPAYFGSSNRVHFQDTLNVPPLKSPFESSDSISFTVRQKSLFRAFTESRALNGQDIDIDFTLKEDNTLIQHEVKEEGEEKITYVLKPGKRYEFTTLFFADFSLLPSCVEWNIEFEIAPIFEAGAPGSCHVSLPDTYPIVITEFTSGDVYAFEQTGSSMSIKIPINIINSENKTDIVYFRALLAYDFIWSDLVVRLLDDAGELVALGQNKFNKNEIVALQLPSGNYTLEIFEPQALEQEELHHCSQFSFSLGIAPHSSNQIQILVEQEEPCPFFPFAHSWNSAAAISVLSDNSMHSARSFRKKGLNSDTVVFTLTEPSYFRAFIPPLTLFDVDMYLQQLVDDVDPITLEKGVSYHKEENIMRRLEPGNYRVVFKYYFFPTDEMCLSFPAELGIASVDFVSTYLSLDPSLCPTSAPVLPPFVKDSPFSGQYFRKTTEAYAQSLAFEVNEPSVLKAKVTYTFFTGHLFFTLEGKNITSPYLSTPKDKTIYAYLGENVAFFDHLLYPGQYVLSFDDDFSYPNNASIPAFCTRFKLEYEFTEGTPENYCDDADTLPTDLFSPFGGSKYFGGPQKLDGTVHISGRNFVLPEYRTHTDMAFRIKEPSWFRAWAKFDHADNDVDFLLWQDKEKKTLISAAAGIDSIESHSAFLMPSNEPYVLDIFVYSRVPDDCRFFHFELAIETNKTISEDLICPDPLPSPLLPPASVIANDFSVTVFREVNVFTNDYVQEHKRHFWLYDMVDYEIAVTVPGPDDYLLFAIVGYDFVLMDVEMRLLDKNHTLIKRSDSEIPPMIDSYVDFESYLQTRLRPGNYTLVISEKIYDMEDHPRLPGTCDKFSFLLGLDSLGTLDNKFRVDRVIPPEGSNLPVDGGLIVTVTFTHSLGSSFPTVGLLAWVNTNSVVYLLDTTDNSKLHPTLVTVQQNRAGFAATFYPLRRAHSYTLKLSEQFLKDENNMALEPYTKEHIYSTFACNCGLHGTCSSNINETICICQKPYVGPECNACELGYHKSHTDCVLNEKCTPDFCNGHGKCSDASGSPICTCDVGYESNDTHICTLCATGYVKSTTGDKCVKKSDGRTTRCSIPILPSTLDSAAHLAVNGRMHIQGEYYIDLVHTEHNMEFTLTKESYFRVYAEPHEIDIDLWLSKVVGDKTELVKFSIAFNEEETIFLKLTPGSYLLNFQYLVLKEIPGSCHSFNFELAISPVTDFQAEVDMFKSICNPTASKLPTLDLTTVPLDTYKWGNDEDIFTATARDDEDGRPRDFYSHPFSVPRGTGAASLIFELRLGYKFLTGDIAVRLERTDVQEVDRKTGQTKNKIVGFGYNGYNQHFLQHSIQEGEYSLVLYIPTAQNRTVAPCTPFTMSLNTYWKMKEEDIFSCPHPKLPSNFNSPTLRDGQDLINVMDQFLVEDWSNSFTFDTRQAVTLRIDATSEIPFSFELQKFVNDKWEPVAHDNEGELYIPELPGDSKYQVVFGYLYLDELFFCPTLDLEFMIRPKAHVTDNLNTFTCPPGHISTVPQLARNFTVGGNNKEFTFTGIDADGKENIYYSFPDFGEKVAEWTIVLTEDMYFDLNIGSHFLTGNIRAELISSNNRVTLRSDSVSFNYNRLVAEVQPDIYTLKLTQQTASGTPLVPCSPYTFNLNIEGLGRWKQNNACEDVSVLQIPKSFDNLGYLGFDKSIKLQSDKWLVPSVISEKILVQTQTSFQIKERSLFRIYVEEHKLDIDIELHTTGADGKIVEGSAPIATGINGFGEESFVVSLNPGYYALQFLFWNWENEKGHCLTFDMEIAISPMLHLPIRPLHCIDDRKHEQLWPSLPSRIDRSVLPYTNDYDGYYQQNDNKGALHSYNITVEFDFDIHLELGYNFIVSDLVLQFSGSEDNFIEYGKNEYTRNVYNKKNVPAGDYTITIYEATANDIDALGCSDFDFFIFLDAAQQSVVEIERKDSGWFPASLNILPYLLYSNEVKFHEQSFLIFSSSLSSYSKTITFDVRAPSLLHLVVDGSANSPPPFVVNLSPGTPKTADLLQLVPTGSHTIYLYPNEKSPHLFGNTLTLANIHLSIQPYDQVKSETTAFCNANKEVASWVPDDITVRSTDGYYHYREKHARLDARQVAITGDLYNMPFEVQEDSIVSVQVYYEFLWGDLHLSLTNKAKTVVHQGYNDFNSNDLQALIAPGSYVLTINNPLGWPSSLDYKLPCSEFFIRISISAADSIADRVDCSAFSIFPWDLMTPSGGSEDFGGPMANGQLRMWSDKFLMNGDGSELASTLSLTQPSVVSMFLSQPTWNDLSAKIVKRGSQNSVAVYSEHHTWYQQVSFFKTTDSSNSQYDLTLSYLPSSWTSCAQFSFGLAIAPIRTVEQALVAACAGPHPTLPAKISQSVIQLNSYFSNKDIETFTTTGKGFAYNMEFSITDNTDIDVSLSYDPTQAFYVLRLYASRGGAEDGWNMFTEGSWRTITEEEESYSFTQIIDVRLDKRFPKYRLAIEQEKPIHVPTTSTQTFCYPFHFVFQLGEGNKPFVRYVEPTQGEKLNPSRDFYLELRFSSKLYYSETGASPKPVDRSKATKDLLVNYVYLQDLDNAAKKVNPFDAKAPEDNPRPDDGTRWLFTFSSKNLEYGKHYQLKLAPSRLFDEAGVEVELRTVNNYTMAEFESRCNGHGTFNEQTKSCVCNSVERRTGPTCSECEPGYHEKDGKCVRPEGCEDRTCGCGPASTSSHCEPLGVCNPSTDPAHPEAVTCSCVSPKYAGNFCEKCAVGYSNYPMCTKDTCNPPCEHGTCKDDGTCQCKDHWAGDQCNQCAPGFTGSNCETEHGIMKVVGMILVALIAIGLLGIGVWWWKFRRVPGGDHTLVTNEEILLEGMGQKLDPGSDSDPSSELGSSSDSWKPEKKVNEGTADADSLEISSSDSSDAAPIGGNLL